MLSEITDKIIKNTIMAINNELQTFGFSDKKTKVYLATMELGHAKAYDIAHKAGLERSTTYDILEKLVRDGLVSFYNKRGVRYYASENPAKIKYRLEEQQKIFSQLLPKLQSIYNTHDVKPQVHYYEGLEGVKTVFLDTLTTQNKMLYGVLSMANLMKIPGRIFMNRYIEQRLQKGIRLKVIRSQQTEAKEHWPTDLAAKRELRYAPMNLVFPMTMYLYNDKVSLISSQKENFGMIVQSVDLHQNMQNLFLALWQMSNPT